MCGICGIAYVQGDRPIDRPTLVRMTEIIRHRGPDSDGYHVQPGIGLGFRRLSIVDLATGDQPIANEDGTVVVICNGEIYNHVELRRQLLARGHRFATASDIEVIVHLYEEHGDDFLRHLRGMFALALWDAPRRRLVLARDRLGIKPLHYALTPEGLFFGSEQKAILASGAVRADIDVQGLRQIFHSGRVVTPRSIVAGIARLAAGHLLVWAGGRPTLRQYWDPSFPAARDYDRRVSEGEWAAAVRAKLEECVRLHLRSDVPLGAWLSAGLDSCSVTAIMSRLADRPVATFTLRPEEPEFDELRTQKGLDDYPEYRLSGHRVVFRAGDMTRYRQGVWHCEDTLIGALAVGQLMLAQASAAEVKVVLTGEGSDEIFGGYSWYATMRVLDAVFRLPQPLRRALGGIPAVRERWPGAANLVAGPRQMNFERYSRSISHLGGQAFGDTLLAPDLRAQIRGVDSGADGPALPAAFAHWHPFAQMQYFDLKVRMADSVVQTLDRTSMAYAVEARVPFLDHELVELAARIPPWVKMKWLREKHVLRCAMRNVLPPDIAKRKKWAMQVPMSRWLRNDLPAFAEERLSASALRAAGYFDPAAVHALRQRHRSGHYDLWQPLSMVLAVQVWHDLFACRRWDRPGVECTTV